MGVVISTANRDVLLVFSDKQTPLIDNVLIDSVDHLVITLIFIVFDDA